MAEEDGTEGATTFTQEQVDEMVAGLKAKNAEVLGEVRRLKDAMKRFEGLGDADTLRTLKEAHEKAEREKQKAQGDWESREQQLKELHEKQAKELADQIAGLTASLHQSVVVRDANGAIARLKASPKALLPHVLPHLRAVEENGLHVTRVVDSQGNVRIANAQGQAMGVEDLLEELRKDPDLMPLFPSQGGAGAGVPASGGRGGSAPSTIPAGDTDAFFGNLEGVAKGTVKVV